MNQSQLGARIEEYPTPFYVFDNDELHKRVAFLKSCLPDNVSLCYAVKANTFLSPYLLDVVDRYEVCSPGELAICTEQNIPSERLVISGVYKTPELIVEHIHSECCAGHYTAESVAQFELLKRAAVNSGRKIHVLLRLTSGNQFGMSEEEIIKIAVNNHANKLIDVCGIQYFSGTQKRSLKKYWRELNYLKNFLEKLQSEYGFSAKELEYGTGFPVVYFEGDDFDEASFLKEFSYLLFSLKFSCKVTLEIGRSIAASCGKYVTKVVDIKSNSTGNYAIVDGGIHHIAYFGQLLAMKHPKVQHFAEESGEERKWNVCGSLCTTNDILIKDISFNNLNAGDALVFENAGAYCPTEGIALFLSRALPAVLMQYKNGSVSTLRKQTDVYPLNNFYWGENYGRID